ncbi:MAG: hypothetical protein ACREJ0_30470 [Geminicoccaceae bacterium]
MTDAITFTLDGREVDARPAWAIWQLARHAVVRPLWTRCAGINPWR